MPDTAPSPAPGAPPWSLRDGLLCASLAGAVALLYAPVAGFGFVSFDDPGYVLKNPLVNQGLTFDGMVRAFTEARMANWHPLTWLSHMLDVELFGLEPGGHHVTSAVIHGLNAVILFVVLRALTGARVAAFAVAALFAVHPLRVESVAWISERKDLLAALFGLATLGAWTRYVRVPGTGRYVVVLIAFALGLMAKPMLVTLPFVLLLLDVWPLRRWAPPGTPGAVPRGRLVREKLPLLALALLSMVVTFLVQRQSAAVSPLDAVPLATRLANAPLAYAGYLGKLVWPVDLAFFYPLPVGVGELPDTGLWLRSTAALALLAVLTLLAYRARRRSPALLVGWLWFTGMLVPVLGLVQVGSQAMADRYTYLPLLGVTVAVVYELDALGRRRPASRPVLAAALAIALVACGLLTSSQVRTWRSSYRLYRHAVDVTTGNALAHHSLGLVHSKRGEPQLAVEQFALALASEPRFDRSEVALGDVLVGQGDRDGAREHYERALAMRRDNVEALYGLASLHVDAEDWQAATRLLQRAVELRPLWAEVHNALGSTLVKLGQLDEAAACFREALRLQPELKEARENLAQLRALRRG